MDNDAGISKDDNILIVKGRFKSAPSNIYGQVLIIFTVDGAIDSFSVAASTFSELYNTEPHEEWHKCEELIADIKWKGNFNANITHSIMDHIKSYSNDSRQMKLLFESVYKYDYNSMDIIIFDIINRVIHDKNLILETGIQEISQKDFYEIKMSRDRKKGEQEPVKGETKTEEGSVILLVKPIVSPVRGKPIYELKVGDKIIIKIVPNSDRANYYLDLFDLRDGSQVKPVPAEVIDIKAGSGKKDPIDILTLIEPGVYGKFTEEEKQVKLRIYDPIVDGPIKKKELKTAKTFTPVEELEEEKGMSKGTIIMLVFIVLILVLSAFLIAINW